MLLSHPSTSLVSLHLAPESTLCLGPFRLAGLVGQLPFHALEGTDSCGGTASMYASRDDWMKPVRISLPHGVHANARDRHHNSPVQFVIEHKDRHLRILWLCETTLRWHRLLESESEETKLCPSEQDRRRGNPNASTATKSLSRNPRARASPLQPSASSLFVACQRSHQDDASAALRTRRRVGDVGQSSAGSEPPSPTFRALFSIQTPSSDSINSPSTNNTAWVERLARSLVSSVTINEFLSLNAGELQPDGLKKSDFSTSEASSEG
ncbi:hypothetical protein D9613_011961 [Agrocybe pediades]|uniref:Uncharacterized protein n=1 Tax=Agrocybe pediades TaxID=84607 RepID=A0A8H4QES5_9AGAR|nr:hypothetical protein D9613_011961 [Agrocybe pediades]